MHIDDLEATVQYLMDRVDTLESQMKAVVKTLTVDDPAESKPATKAKAKE
jgi:hypothetical protein